MNTKVLMMASSIFFMICGLGITFVPEEISESLYADINQTSILFLQLLGSLYLGFGMLNWMAKNNLIGGIYSRPLVIGNMAHFLVASFALTKMIGKYAEDEFPIFLALTILYIVFTLCFGYVFMKNPYKLPDANGKV